MKPLLSEFSYGFALVDELIHWEGLPITAAPVYPSLYDEGGMGYDVALDRDGIPLFLQFKLSHHLTTWHAREARAGMIQVPYYRFELHRRDQSNQHRLLRLLEQEGQEVYYVAPEFHLTTELNAAYLSHSVRDRSRFVRPDEIGPQGDDRQHHVSFRPDTLDFVFSSKPVPKRGSITGKKFDALMENAVRERGSEALKEPALEELRRGMSAILTKKSITNARTLSQLGQRLSTLGQIAYLARVFFGCTFLVVQKRQEANESSVKPSSP